MLLPFAPFAFLPGDVTRFAWVAIDAAVAVWAIRRLRLPAYWLAFPPLFEAIVLGHPEVLLLGLLIGVSGPLAGLAALVKPYAVLPLLAERRFLAIVIAGVATGATLLILPWGQFLAELSTISANLARQNVGDSTFGDPALMVIGGIALIALGPRRALWLAVPVLWPYAQPIYKVMSIPVLPPVLALAWAIPIPGMTLMGVVVLAVLTVVNRQRTLPGWLVNGIRPASTNFEAPAALATGLGTNTVGAALRTELA